MLFTLDFCRYSGLATTCTTTSSRRRHDGRPVRTTYQPSTLKTLRKSCPRSRLPDDLWNNLGELGIRKPVRSRRKRKTPNANASVVELIQPEVPNTTFHSSFATVPDIFMANVRSLQPKLDELHSITALLRPGIICLTETWLNDSILDAACNLHNYVCFRRDRVARQRGGVCAYIDAHLPCKRLIDYEDHEVESLWISVHPFRLPRSITNILRGVVYHLPHFSAAENRVLTDHLMKNADQFLAKHPEGLIVICGDILKYTGLSAQVVKRSMGLSQVVTVLTRDSGTLDWALTNKQSLFCPPVQLSKIARSDHYAVLIKPDATRLNRKTEKKYIMRRDLRESSL